MRDLFGSDVPTPPPPPPDRDPDPDCGTDGCCDGCRGTRVDRFDHGPCFDCDGTGHTCTRRTR